MSRLFLKIVLFSYKRKFFSWNMGTALENLVLDMSSFSILKKTYCPLFLTQSISFSILEKGKKQPDIIIDFITYLNLKKIGQIQASHTSLINCFQRSIDIYRFGNVYENKHLHIKKNIRFWMESK